MERQSSYGSGSSAGSAFSGRSADSRGAAGKDHGKGAAEDLQKQGQLIKALFGALYTLAKEKMNDSARMAYLTIGVDFLLICCLFLMPEYPWAADAHNPIFKIFFYVEFHLPIAHTGYRFYLIVFYILVATLFISTGICIWVGWCFKNDSFPFLWPIKVARIVVSLFVSMFYIASLNIFLIAMQCKPEYDEKGKRHWVHLIYHHDCLAMPHAIHAGFSLVSSVLFFVVALLLVVADHELEPLSHSLLAAPHSMTELRMLLAKTVITVADILLRPAPHIQVSLYAAACLLMLWFQLRWAPHLSAWINCLRAGLNAILAWISVTLMAVTFSVSWIPDDASGSHSHFTWTPWRTRQIWTMLMAAGVPVAFLAGMGGMYWRLHHAWRTALKFANADPAARPRSIHTFFDDFDVEVAARIGRVFDAEGAPADPAAQDVTEAVLRAGVAMFPASPYLHIVYSNFLIEVRKNNSAGWAQLETARKLEPNLSYRFSIFTREQEHKQKSAAGSSGEQAVDLVSYVEFQKNYRALLEYHRAALEANREFWRLVMRDTVPLSSMSRSFAVIDAMEGAAAHTYRLVLDRYPRNAKLLRSYGRFLENVRNDPWAAAKYYAEAEKQEELAASAVPEIALAVGEGGEANASVLAALSDKDNAIITINATGVIQMANKAAQKLLGYKKGELEGKNVNVLMPPPFNARHNGYLKAYQNTGRAHILDSTVEVVALHKERHILPVSIGVSKASGSGADATFMSVIRPVQPAVGEMKAWLLPSGGVLCVDQGFVDYTGWATGDLVGRALSSVALDPGELESIVGQAAKSSAQELRNGISTGTLQFKHKYGGQVGLTLRLVLGGSEGQRLLVARMTPTEEGRLMLAVDHKGCISYANTGLAALLGFKLAALRARDFAALLPPPYNVLHGKWLKEAELLDARQAPGSCRSGASVHLLSANGTPVPVRAAISHHAGSLGQGASWAVAVTRSSEATAASERRLQLRVRLDGTIASANNGTPGSLFGCDPARLAGSRLDALVDVFWEHSKAGHEIGPALTALLMRSNATPGTSWRVGVGKVEEAAAEAAARAAAQASSGRTIMRQPSRQGGGKVKAAVMTVAVIGAVGEEEGGGLESGDAGEGGGNAAEADGAALIVSLWRADLISAVVELGPGCTILRADPCLGRLFGVQSTSMLQHHLHKYVNLPSSTTLGDMMGISESKKGGMKKAHTHSIGPRRQLQARHPDGRPLLISLQAVPKDGSSLARLVVLIKPVTPAKGSPSMLKDLVTALNQAATADVLSEAARSAADGDGNSSRGLNEVDGDAEATGPLSRVPGLPLGEMALLSAGADDAAPTTRRGAERDPATARGVELDMAGGETTRGARRVSVDKGGDAPAKAKQPLSEAEREAELAARGSSKARAWLESGFHHALADEGEVQLPGAVREDGSGGEGDEATAVASEPEGAAKEAPPHSGGVGHAVGSEAEGATSASDVTGGGSGGDFARGKRLRRLLRVLNSYATVKTLNTFNTRVLLMSCGVLLLHVAAFAAIMAALANEESYLHEVDATGALMDAIHRSCSFARIIEAAQRDYGYVSADMPTYAALMNSELDKVEALHQGLYLGFKGLRSIEVPAIRRLWHEPGLNVTRFDEGANGTLGVDSLFNIGEMLLAAGREVAFTGASRATAPLATNARFRFLLANGPSSAYSAYLHSLNLMALRAQESIAQLQRLVLVLLVVEDVGVCLGAVAALLAIFAGLTAHRASVVSVFLAVPNAALRALANKSTAIDEEEDDSDDEDVRAAETEMELRQKKHDQAHAQAEEEQAGAKHDGEGARAASGAGSMRRRVSIAGKGSADAGATSLARVTKGVLSLDALLAVDISERQAMLFNGKQLLTSSRDVYKLMWPFLLWGMLLAAMYGVSYASFASISHGSISVKLGHRTQTQVSRVAFYVGEATLAPTAAERAAVQPQLASEARLLERIYSAHLYGGPTLPDSLADGSKDAFDGALFRSPRHADLLFRTSGCMRKDTSACAVEGSPWYAVSQHAIDPMVWRLREEAELLARDNATEITPDDANSRYAYVWTVAAWDLHDGMQELILAYLKEEVVAIASERAVHIALLGLAVVCIGAFLVLLFRPFLARVRKEGRRVGELLVQLPAEIDTDTLVAALTDRTRAAARQPLSSDGGAPWQARFGTAAAASTPTVPLLLGAGNRGERVFSPRGVQEQQGGWHSSGDAQLGRGGDGMRRRFGGGQRIAPE